MNTSMIAKQTWKASFRQTRLDARCQLRSLRGMSANHIRKVARRMNHESWKLLRHTNETRLMQKQ